MKAIKFITAIILSIFFVGCDNPQDYKDVFLSTPSLQSATTDKMVVIEPLETPYAIVIHGGAGSISPEKYSEEKEKRYLNALDTALQIGEQSLKEGKAALDVVQDVIIYLEGNPLFNSGKGAVLTSKGEAELDASIMDGKSLNAGAVAGVRTIKNPILGARAVMDSSVHVMLSGEGADVFAKEAGLEIVENKYFITEKRRKNFEKKVDKQGTVGCVVLDTYGNLAAGTSTGGTSGKSWGRIGDSPVIGAGTYANNNTAAISCTGHGEYFIRRAVAHDVHARMMYGNKSLKEACDAALKSVDDLGGTGGLIAVDKDGNVAVPFNTKGMFRAYKTKDQRVVAMYK